MWGSSLRWVLFLLASISLLAVGTSAWANSKAARIVPILSLLLDEEPLGARVVAFAWADQESATSSYAPPGLYSYNATGGSISITRLSAGQYEITFENIDLNEPHNVLVSSVNSGAKFCSILTVSNSTATIYCYNAATDALADAMFSIAVSAEAKSDAKVAAYVIANTATGNYTPNTTTSFNANGGTFNVQRFGAGQYDVSGTFTPASASVVQVTAIDADRFCMIISWTATTIQVDCFSNDGASADTRFSIAFISTDPSQVSSEIVGYGHYQGHSSLANAYNQSGGTVTRSDITDGRLVTFEGLDLTDNYQIQVSTNDSFVTFNSHNCSVGDVANQNQVEVFCVDEAGNPSTSTYFSIWVVQKLN